MRFQRIFHYLVLTLGSLVLVACIPGGEHKSMVAQPEGGPRQESGSDPRPGAASAPSGSPQASVPGTSVELQGTSSGGGTLADKQALEILTLARSALAEILLRAHPRIFSQLPEAKGQAWLAQIIRSTELRPLAAPQRYGRPLRFDYEGEQLTATRYFVEAVGQVRFWARPAEEQLRVLIDTMIDLLHEASHLYGIGITEESDMNSEAWALRVMDQLSRDTIGCASEVFERPAEGLADGDTQPTKAFLGILLHRPTGLISAERYSVEESVGGEQQAYGIWAADTTAVRLRFLLSPFLYIEAKQSFGGERWATDSLVKRVQELAGTSPASSFVRPIDSDEDFLLFQEPLYDESAFSPTRPQWPRKGTGFLGLPEIKDGEWIYSRNALYADKISHMRTGEPFSQRPVEAYDKLVVSQNRDELRSSGSYSFGLRADTNDLPGEVLQREGWPLYDRTYNLSCVNFGNDPILVEPFVGDLPLGEEELPVVHRGWLSDYEPDDEARDFQPYLKSVQALFAHYGVDENMSDLILRGKNSSTRAKCNFEAIFSQGASRTKTVLFSLQQELVGQKTADTPSIAAAVQMNFHLENGKATALNSVDRRLIEASATAEKIFLRVAAHGATSTNTAGFTTEAGHPEKVDGYETEITLRLDPETGDVREVSATDHRNGRGTFSCAIE